jgi:hypothetical protein
MKAQHLVEGMESNLITVSSCSRPVVFGDRVRHGNGIGTAGGAAPEEARQRLSSADTKGAGAWESEGMCGVRAAPGDCCVWIRARSPFPSLGSTLLSGTIWYGVERGSRRSHRVSRVSEQPKLLEHRISLMNIISDCGLVDVVTRQNASYHVDAGARGVLHCRTSRPSRVEAPRSGHALRARVCSSLDSRLRPVCYYIADE